MKMGKMPHRRKKLKEEGELLLLQDSHKVEMLEEGLDMSQIVNHQ